MTPEEQEKHYEDLCELAYDNETVLFAVKEMEKLTRQVIDLTAKLERQTALAAQRLPEVKHLKMTIHCLFNDYGRHMSAEWKKALRPILGITVSSDD